MSLRLIDIPTKGNVGVDLMMAPIASPLASHLYIAAPSVSDLQFSPFLSYQVNWPGHPVKEVEKNVFFRNLSVKVPLWDQHAPKLMELALPFTTFGWVLCLFGNIVFFGLFWAIFPVARISLATRKSWFLMNIFFEWKKFLEWINLRKNENGEQ